MLAALDYICDLSPYLPGKPGELVAREYGIDPGTIIKLASNENPLGPSPKALKAMQAAARTAHRYPEQYDLIKTLAGHLGMPDTSIALGNGSNDVLDLIARTYLTHGTEAISSQYAFAVYQIATQSTGARNVIVPAKDFGHDLEATLKAITPRTKVIWIANPNNPTGTFIPYAELKTFLGKVPSEAVVVLDEAYREYLKEKDQGDAQSWLAGHPNLILVRTFSKIYGLAGARIGYGIADPEIIQLLNRVRHPFNCNSLGLAGATAALGDQEFVRRSRKTNAEGIKQLQAGCDELGLTRLPAYGNFLTIEVPGAAAVNEALLHKGFIVRPLAPYGLPNHLRVTVGTPAQNTRLLAALKTI